MLIDVECRLKTDEISARCNIRLIIATRKEEWINIGVATRGEMNLSRLRDTVFHGRALLQFARCRIRTRDRVRISHVGRASRYIQCCMKYAALFAVTSTPRCHNLSAPHFRDRDHRRRILDANRVPRSEAHIRVYYVRVRAASVS